VLRDVAAPRQLSPFLDNVLLFGRLLRRAGLPVAPDQSLGLARALEWVDLGDREQVFCAARALLVYRHQDLGLFEVLFRRFWRGGEAAAPHRRPNPLRPPNLDHLKRFDAVHLMGRRPREADREIAIGERSGSFSPEEVLQQRDFAQLTPEELAAVRRLIAETRWRLSQRQTRRLVADPRGERIHLRRVLREAARQGGAAFRLARQSRKVKQRPLVLLADVSGSMEKYSRLILQFFYSVSHGLDDVECFVFGTRLTRITPQIRVRNVDRALDEAARQILDFSGGTRIGESIGAFNRHWGRRVLRRGAVVLVISDGWERGGSAALKREMRHLQRRCHRLIWLNPHLGHPGYQPLVEGMAAALPFVDDFLPIHNLASLRALAERLAALPGRRTGLPARRPGPSAPRAV
jgi:uncharacterized protein